MTLNSMVQGSRCWCGQLLWYGVLGSCGVWWCARAPVVFKAMLGVLVLVFGGRRYHGFPSLSIVPLLFS